MSKPAEGGGALGRRRARDRARASTMKKLGIERTTGRCACCYQIIAVDSSRSRYRHVCRG